MNKLFTFALSSILLTAPLAASQAAPAPIQGQPVVKGFQLSVSSTSQEYNWGQPIYLDTAIKNVSDQSQGLFVGPETTIEVTTGKGEPIPITRYQQQWLHSDGRRVFFGIGTYDVSPGETYKLPQHTLNREFDLSAADVYLVKVTYRLGYQHTADITSNTLRITVK